MEQADPRHLLVKIAKTLEKLKISYLVTGGMAVLVWGRPRFTADIDIIIKLKSENVDKLEKALKTIGEAGYIDKAAIEEAIVRRGEFSFIDGETGVKVDFWVIKDDSFDLRQLKRRTRKEILDKRVYFITPEDLILNKLIWYKDCQSERHLEDVESVLKISKSKIDLNYLKKWAKHKGVLGILNKILKKK